MKVSMKIAIIGYSGSGKSTLARKLGEAHGCAVLHLDSVFFSSDWVERSNEEMSADVERFMENESWVIDGNYSRTLYERRMEEADQIILMDFGRFDCLRRAFRRYRTYRGTTRPDMAAGCNEKFDWAFIRWILWEGRTKKARDRYKGVISAYPKKTIVLKNQTELDHFLARV